MYKAKNIYINDKKLAYYEFGKGEKTLIFLSGFGTPFPLLDMYNLCVKLENDFRCIVVDRFGYGNSSTVNTNRAASNITNEIIELLIRLNINPKEVIIVGHSLGAVYALDIAIKIKPCGVTLIDYENINFINTLSTKLGYGIYYGMCMSPMKSKMDENMIKSSVAQINAPKKIKDEAISVIKYNLPNMCIKSELDFALKSGKSVNSKLKNVLVNSGLLIYTKKNEKANLKLAKRFKTCETVLSNFDNHFIHNSEPELVASSIKSFFKEDGNV